MKKILKDYLILIFVAIIIAIPMFNKNLNVYEGNGIQHIARAYGTYTDFLDGTIFPNIISSFANGFGYSWNLFYGPLSLYGIILFKLIFSSFISSYKIFTFICLILSGIFMYKFVKNITENGSVSVLAGAIYMAFPYHITSLYILNSLGEFVSYVFIPIVFLGLYDLFDNKRRHYYITIGAVGLILTHSLSAAVTLVFSLLYILMNIKKLKNIKIIKLIILNVIFIIAITSFFTVGVLETKFKADYQIYSKTADEQIVSEGLSINSLFATGRNEKYVFELGPHIILMLAVSVMTFSNIKENKKEYVFFFIIGFICLWMSTKYFPLKLIQYPWRILQFVCFFFTFVCAMNMYTVIKNINYKDTIIAIVICLIYIMALKSYVPYTENILEIKDIELGYVSGKEVETVYGIEQAFNLPEKAYNNRFYIATREDNIYVLKGKALITEEEKNGSNMKANIKTMEDDTVFELPYIYYPGYEIRADGMVIDNFETDNGFLGISIGKNDDAEIDVIYKGTNLMKISAIISLISLMIFAMYTRYYIKNYR